LEKDRTLLIKQLLEAGVHFGHQTKKWNPKMKGYIFGEKSGIYIIDIQKTCVALEEACKFLQETVATGGYVLFVGTKKQAQNIIKEEAKRCGMFFVSERWLGGMLTNFQTIRKSVKRLKELEAMKEDGTFELLSKKEQSQLGKEMEKLVRNLEGVKQMNQLPDAVFVIDSKNEEIAVKEAVKLSIPVVALIDTNCDPDMIKFPVPGNDDAIRSIKLITSIITDSIAEGRRAFSDVLPEESEEQEAGSVSDEEEVEDLGDDFEDLSDKEKERRRTKFKAAREKKTSNKEK
jgi:small subunit ribosomal protein S2